MSEWMPIDKWPDCVRWERPGIVFELTNAEGRSLYAPCGLMPETPFDWKSPPTRFRAVEEKPPTHSTPIPAPVQK
jgi:hypothetical protein